MSLEFGVQHPCVLRARYSEKHLREWGRLGNLHTILTTGDQSAPSADKIKWVEDAGAEVELLQNETAVCSSCPACLPEDTAGEGEAVGCLGRISYPIEAQFEKFLADRVQLALDTLDQSDQPRLLRILVDPESPFDGEATRELRCVTTAGGLRFFESRLPISLTREGSRLTTDNIFDAIAGFRSAYYYDFLDLLLRNDLTESETSRLHARSRNYVQFLRLLAALERAEALSTRVLVD